MVIVLRTSYPTEKAPEMGKRFLEVPALPDYITRRGPYVLGVREAGIQSITVYEIDRSTKLAEACEEVAKQAVHFIGVAGYTYSIDVCFEVDEALKMIGL
ncbi:MAG: hypothetical protein ACWGSD_11960 [Thermodesulfobacteriota bacterium]